MIKDLALVVNHRCKLHAVVAPREADHQMVDYARQGYVLLANDSDFIGHQGVEKFVTKFTQHNNEEGTYTGLVYEQSAIKKFASDLAAMRDDDKREKKMQETGDNATKMKQALQMFAIIHRRGWRAIAEFFILSQNDYAKVDQVGLK